ncbi:RING/U-box superfamily protein [Zea mays]|uniref:RING/U-box superfamily protein n=1 Tax=Zea mays TaxID=4577 RepID=A0A1D6FDB0_MAIZE|nr:RING/U-box superfamily protein [Zea mays]
MDRQQGRAPRTHHLPLAAGRAAGKPRRRTSGFFVTIWIATVMFKSNDILCKQTALKRERKITVLVGITILFVVHVSGFYWCYKNGDLIRPLMMLPPKEIPPFWHAIFIILVNGSNVDDCGIFSTFVLCIIAYTCVVPFFPEQGVWKPIFVSNHWLVSHFQVDICCGKDWKRMVRSCKREDILLLCSQEGCKGSVMISCCFGFLPCNISYF